MSLSDWCDSGWVRTHEPRPGEIAKGLKAADRDLESAEVDLIALEWRFSIAYNAILQAAAAALAAAGYRAARDLHHYRVLQSLRMTIGVDAVMVDKLDKFRKKRHIGVYEEVGAVSAAEVAEIIAVAREIRGKVEVWIRREHPELS